MTVKKKSPKGYKAFKTSVKEIKIQKVVDPFKKMKFAVGTHIHKSVRYVLDRDPEFILWFKNSTPRCYWPKGFESSINIALDLIEQKNAAIRAEKEELAAEHSFIRAMKDFQKTTGISAW